MNPHRDSSGVAAITSAVAAGGDLAHPLNHDWNGPDWNAGDWIHSPAPE